VENLSLIPSPKTGTVKWPATRKNYTYLTMPDGRDVFLHRDDFTIGEWPPRYRSQIEFELLETGHKTCPLRAKDAKPTGAK
jgi:cold shock CspA family protein